MDRYVTTLLPTTLQFHLRINRTIAAQIKNAMKFCVNQKKVLYWTVLMLRKTLDTKTRYVRKVIANINPMIIPVKVDLIKLTILVLLNALLISLKLSTNLTKKYIEKGSKISRNRTKNRETIMKYTIKNAITKICSKY